MLFSYNYVPHDVEKLQAWLDHLVKEVWCKACGEFKLDLLDPELQEIVQAIADDNKTKLKLFEPIRDLFDLFKGLSTDQRAQFARWYDANNNIEALCSNSPEQQPVTYAEVAVINAPLAEQLKAFYTDLWVRVLGLSPVKTKIGPIDAHYRDFVSVNKQGKCPYCGLFNLDGEHDVTRDAYDHFLPKATYPFNSVNFRNLAPMCGKCNSGYKLQKDPVCHLDPIKRKTGNTRRKAFYSYAAVHPRIEVSMSVNTKNSQDIQPEEIAISLTAPGKDEEVESWREVFGIEQRYKARCCGENDGKAWLIRVTEENILYDRTTQQMLEAEIRAAEKTPWSDANFLKKPFLEACRTAGIV